MSIGIGMGMDRAPASVSSFSLPQGHIVTLNR